jgi:hypothetical protein
LVKEDVQKQFINALDIVALKNCPKMIACLKKDWEFLTKKMPLNPKLKVLEPYWNMIYLQFINKIKTRFSKKN